MSICIPRKEIMTPKCITRKHWIWLIHSFMKIYDNVEFWLWNDLWGHVNAWMLPDGLLLKSKPNMYKQFCLMFVINLLTHNSFLKLCVGSMKKIISHVLSPKKLLCVLKTPNDFLKFLLVFQCLSNTGISEHCNIYKLARLYSYGLAFLWAFYRQLVKILLTGIFFVMFTEFTCSIN